MHGTFSWSKCYLFYCAPLLFHSLTPMSPLRSIVLTMYLGYRLPDGSIDSFLTISPSSMQWQQTLVRLGGGAVGLSWAQDLPRHWWVRCFFRVSCLYGFYQRSDFIYNYIFFFLFFFLRYLCKIQLFGVSASHVAEFIFGYHYHLGPFSFLTLYVTGDQVHAFSTGFATHYGWHMMQFNAVIWGKKWWCKWIA